MSTHTRPRGGKRWARFLLAILACSVPTFGEPRSVDALQISSLQGPQSFLADPSGEQYFISNANGDPDAKDNNGFITKLDQAGKVSQLQFIQGGTGGTTLHAPKGMAIADGVLYVADLDTLRGFDKTTGLAVVTVSFEKYRQAGTGVALVDVVYDGKNFLYLSDTDANTIYQINLAQQHAVSVLAKDSLLAGPRGLAVHPKTGHLIAVSWNKGKILEVTPEGAISELVSNSFFSSRFNNLNGVDFDNLGNMYVSDFTAGKVWRMRPDRRFDVIAEYLPSPADIGIDRKNHLILVPYEYANAAEMNGLESPVKSKGQKRTLADYGFTGGPKDVKEDAQK
jgi:hypothetical protein